MPARAGIKVTKTRSETRATSKSSKTVTLGSGTKRCPTCGKFMGNGGKR